MTSLSQLLRRISWPNKNWRTVQSSLQSMHTRLWMYFQSLNTSSASIKSMTLTRACNLSSWESTKIWSFLSMTTFLMFKKWQNLEVYRASDSSLWHNAIKWMVNLQQAFHLMMPRLHFKSTDRCINTNTVKIHMKLQNLVCETISFI